MTAYYIVTVIVYFWWLRTQLPCLTPTGKDIFTYLTILINELGFFILWSAAFIAVVWWKSSLVLAIILVWAGWYLRQTIYSLRGLM